MKNKVLKGVGYLMGIIWIISACAIDSETPVPLFLLLTSSSYLILFAYANNWFEDYE